MGELLPFLLLLRGRGQNPQWSFGYFWVGACSDLLTVAGTWVECVRLPSIGDVGSREQAVLCVGIKRRDYAFSGKAAGQQ